MSECPWVTECECKNPDNLKEGNFINSRVCMLCMLGQLIENSSP